MLGYLSVVSYSIRHHTVYIMDIRLFLIASILGMAWADLKESDAAKFIAKVNAKSQQLASAWAQKEWDYKTTLTAKAAKALAGAKENFFKYRAEVVPQINKYAWKKFNDASLKRQFQLLSQLNEAGVSPQTRETYFQLINKMVDAYSRAKVREFNSTSGKLLGYNDISDIFSKDYLDACETSFYWQGWHDTIGQKVKPDFVKYVALSNEVAKANGYTDNAARWQARYEVADFGGVIKRLYEKIKPLVLQVHAWVRRKLWEAHGKDSSVVDLKGPIAASMMGDIWGMNGIAIYNITCPYPGIPTIDATPQLVAQNYNGLKMAKTAEKFFVSLGLSPMTEEYWKYSIFEQPKGKDIDCSQESFNFYDGKNYRTEYCTQPNLDDFGGIHHEMGKIENFMAWKNLPYAFQDSPSPGFSEVLGEVVNQFVTGPTHLKSLGLIDANWKPDKQQEVNYLMQQALYDVLFLPYAYSLEQWRWKVFQGKITPDNYNCEYWKTRIDLQGVEPPVDRTSQDLDPAAKHYVDNDEEYIKFYLNIILQYQIHRELCILAGKFDPKKPDAKPLYLCDITGNKAVGDKLKSMMALGASRTWQDELEMITGEREADASAIMDYFRPLYDWLEKTNKKNKEKIGWNPSKKQFCKDSGALKSAGKSSCQYS